MSKLTRDGGAAFPALTNEMAVERLMGGGDHEGMSLRDYFAGQALAGIFNHDGAEDCSLDQIASDCYLYADAMIEARGK